MTHVAVDLPRPPRFADDMASFEFFTVDVFTRQRFGGNPLAVFPQAQGLTEVDMQNLAREFNYSETTFVLPPADKKHTAHVRIFTPAREVPFAGHPNVGTAYVLAQQAAKETSSTLVFEEKAGLVHIELRRDGGRVTGASIAAPRSLSTGEKLTVDVVAACAGLKTSDISTAVHPPLLAGVGLDFVFAELTSREALSRAKPDPAACERTAKRYPNIGEEFLLHLYARDPASPNRLATRMFAPLSGILEDPATGSANAALAALLTQLNVKGSGTHEFEIAQGIEMGRPSQLFASAEKKSDGSVIATIAGDCVPVMRGRVEV
jgi:trans-2,3-dihydro-3-hydroxyanthranilate isomerase